MVSYAEFRFVVASIIWTSVYVAALFIEQEPSSLLIPANKTCTLTCVADGCPVSECSGRWRINDSYTHNASNQPKSEFIAKGFFFPQPDYDGNRQIIALTVNASVAINNTNICCVFTSDRTDEFAISQISTLLVIEDLPLPNNPMLVKNTTHVTVSWSPPFLWSGEAISHYNISFIKNMDVETVTHHLMNHTYSDSVVSYSQEITDELLTCAEVMFVISAVGKSSSSGTLRPYNISSCMTSSDIAMSAAQSPVTANTTVLFNGDGAATRVEVYVKLPPWICSCQKLNYSLLFENENGDLVLQIGPVSHTGPGVVKHVVTSAAILEGNQKYSLKVKLESYSQEVTMEKHDFSTIIVRQGGGTSSDTAESSDADVYKATTVVALVVLVLMFLVIISTVTAFIYIRHKQKAKEQRCIDAKRRVCHTMVPNPIYGGDDDDDNHETGPVYDSIRPQYEILASVSRDFTNANNKVDDTKTVRYVDQPGLQSSHLRSQSFVTYSTVSDNNTVIPPRSGSLSVTPPARLIALKKNGEERNKLHLTLSLVDGSGPATTIEESGSSADHDVQGEVDDNLSPPQTNVDDGSGVMEESYMVMNPVSVK